MISYDLTPENVDSIKKLIDQLALVYAHVNSMTQEEREAIHRYARISMIGASTRIENALLTDWEVNWLDTILTQDGKTTALESNRDLIENKLSKDRERSIEEVAGCRQFLLTIYETSGEFYPLRESDLRELHRVLMAPYQGAGPYVGQYKGQSNSVVEYNHATKKTRTVFQTADAGVMTQAAMSDLIHWYNEARLKETLPLTVSCEFVFRFLAIHPFQDGNGRMGRGLFLLSLLQSNLSILSGVARYLAIDRHIEKHKEEYYAVLNQCSNGQFSQDPSIYKITYFLRFMIKILSNAVQDVHVYSEKYRQEQRLSSSAAQVLKCFRENPEIRLTPKLIMEITGLPRRTIGHALTSLLKAHFIQSYGQGAGTRYQLTF